MGRCHFETSPPEKVPGAGLVDITDSQRQCYSATALTTGNKSRGGPRDRVGISHCCLGQLVLRLGLGWMLVRTGDGGGMGASPHRLGFEIL